eukprot:jgi/Mesen1/1654/ME000135S00654
MWGRRDKKKARAPPVVEKKPVEKIEQWLAEPTTVWRDKLQDWLDPPEIVVPPKQPLVKKITKGTELSADEIKAKEELRAWATSRKGLDFIHSEEARAQALQKEVASQSKRGGIPHVPHPQHGEPMLRRQVPVGSKTGRSEHEMRWQWMKQHLFSKWGFQTHFYPVEKPFDLQTAIGSEALDRAAYVTMVDESANNLYYKDRLGRTRGPMTLTSMRTAVAAGIIDKQTLAWAPDLDEWAPIEMIYGLGGLVLTPQVKMAAQGLAFVMKLATFVNPLKARRGFEFKDFEAEQAAALRRREDDRAVLDAHGGVWPGERTPIHVLGMWGGGTNLTNWIEQRHKRVFPDKYITPQMREVLFENIPGLKPRHIFEVESFFDRTLYSKPFFRPAMGALTESPSCISGFSKDPRFEEEDDDYDDEDDENDPWTVNERLFLRMMFEQEEVEKKRTVNMVKLREQEDRLLEILYLKKQERRAKRAAERAAKKGGAGASATQTKAGRATKEGTAGSNKKKKGARGRK